MALSGDGLIDTFFECACGVCERSDSTMRGRILLPLAYGGNWYPQDGNPEFENYPKWNPVPYDPRPDPGFRPNPDWPRSFVHVRQISARAGMTHMQNFWLVLFKVFVVAFSVSTCVIIAWGMDASK